MRHRLQQRFRLQDHPWTAAELCVVNGPMPVVGKVTELVEFDLDQPRLNRAANYARRKRSGKHLWEQSDDVYLEQSVFSVVGTGVRGPTGYCDAYVATSGNNHIGRIENMLERVRDDNTIHTRCVTMSGVHV